MSGQPVDQQFNDLLIHTNFLQEFDNAEFGPNKPMSGGYAPAMMAQGRIPHKYDGADDPPQTTIQGHTGSAYHWPHQPQVTIGPAYPPNLSQGNNYQSYQQPYNLQNTSHYPTALVGRAPSAIQSNVAPQPTTRQASIRPQRIKTHQRADALDPSRRPLSSPRNEGQRPGRGPLLDKTNRVQKAATPIHSTTTYFALKGPTGEKLQQWHEFMAHKGTYADHQPTEFDFDDLHDFFRGLDKGKSRAMSRDTTRHQRYSHSLVSKHDEAGISAEKSKQEIADLYCGYQKEFRPRDSALELKFKCTLGCAWSHKTKANWERHERTHYPQEIWICSHQDCLEKSAKTRVSFRKDLARRHHADHHKVHGEADLTDRQLGELIVPVTSSMFPRVCVFEGCLKQFTSWDERSTHVEGHLKREDILRRDRILKYTLNKTIKEEPDVDAEHDLDDDMRHYSRGLEEDTIQEEDDEDGEEDDDDDDADDDPDHDGSRLKDPDPDDETGAGGSGGNIQGLYGSSMKGIGGWASGNGGQQSDQGTNYDLNNYDFASNFDTFGGSGYISPVDKRPWKSLMSLRLQLLPQVFARGIAQTPLVLKKIQLQAALALEASGVKKIQITRILRREIAIMASAIPLSSGPYIPGFPRSAAMTNILPGLARTLSHYNTTSIARQNRAISKFSGLGERTLSEKIDDLYGQEDDPDAAFCDSLSAFDGGGHIYRCLRVSSSTNPIRPTRLIHVGSRTKPVLHLDTSEVFPSQVSYCSLSHCWDDGYALCLSRDNMASLRNEIPADSLTQTVHLAINIARNKGVEYVWIDTLCIVQDSHEDIITEVPRITQIHASATFSIVITSIAFAEEGKSSKESFEDVVGNQGQLQEINYRRSFHHRRQPTEDSISTSTSQTPELTNGPSVADTNSTKPRLSSQSTSDYIPEMQEFVSTLPQRRGSHQLESFLAEPPKKSFFLPILPLDKLATTSSQPSIPLPQRTKRPLSCKVYDSESSPSPSPITKSQNNASTYLDKWHSRWQRLSSKSEAGSPVTSREPSISDLSFHSEKKRGPLSFPVVWEKLFKGFRRKDIYDFEIGCDAREPDG